MKTLLRSPNLDAMIVDFRGAAPLAWAIWAQKIEVVRLLLPHYAVGHDDTDSKGRSGLWTAMRHGAADVAAVILEADPRQALMTDRAGRSLLIAAAKGGKMTTFVKLMSGQLSR